MKSGSSSQKEFTVTVDDQKLINRFARLYKKSIELKMRLQQVSSELQDISDASDMILLMDDADAQSIPVSMGTSFVHMDQDSLNQKLEKMKSELKEKLNELNVSHTKVSNEITSLKLILYMKFGDSINLETNDDDDV